MLRIATKSLRRASGLSSRRASIHIASFESVDLVEQKNGVATIKLARPELHNAFNATVISDITMAFDVVAKNNNNRCVVLTGLGRVCVLLNRDIFVHVYYSFTHASTIFELYFGQPMFSSLRLSLIVIDFLGWSRSDVDARHC
jgi:hypothetical protein